MGDIFLSTLNSIAPIVLLILLGYLLKRVGFLTKPFLSVGNKLVFNVLLPCMLFINIYDGMDSFSDIPWNFVAYCLIGMVVIFGIGLLVAVLTTKRNDRRGVITQVTFRCNFAIIGLVLISRIGGEEAAAVGGMVSAFSAPLCNILAVIALSYFDAKNRKQKKLLEGPEGNGASALVISESSSGDVFADDLSLKSSGDDLFGNPGGVSAGSSGGDELFGDFSLSETSYFVFDDGPAGRAAKRRAKRAKKKAGETPSVRTTVKKTVINIVTNPVLLGTLTGLLFVGIRELERAVTGGDVPFTLKGDLTIIYTIVDDLKAICSPFALIVLGGQFEFRSAHGMTKEIVVGVIMRIVVAPLLGIGCAVLIDSYTNFFAAGMNYPTIIALFGTPVAVSSAVMAGNMGGDEQLATQYVVWTSICSIVTIFATVFLLQYFGLITIP
ncbi:MAG: AEC family transporter [Clostridia bacterium]|nr:AEC family transporter [Clostridia bacterium]